MSNNHNGDIGRKIICPDITECETTRFAFGNQFQETLKQVAFSTSGALAFNAPPYELANAGFRVFD